MSKTVISFGLQSIVIDVENLNDIKGKVERAKKRYAHLYKREGVHSVLIKILLPHEFTAVLRRAID